MRNSVRGALMKILVFSDSHNHISLMEAAIQTLRPDLICHLGDYDRDAFSLSKRFPSIPLRSVRGNCDIGSATPILENFLFAEKRIILTHGHRYYVKSDLTELKAMGQAADADILLFGHTHIPYYEQTGKLHNLNPGPAAKSCAQIQIVDGKIECTHLPLSVYADL